MSYYNKMSINFKAVSENESFARTCVASFCLPLNPTVDEITDIKTAVSEGVTNAIVHAYEHDSQKEIFINVELQDKLIIIEIIDYGVGIENIDKVKIPFYTTKPNSERSGMGFTVMESFMDKVEIESELNNKTTIRLYKTIKEE